MTPKKKLPAKALAGQTIWVAEHVHRHGSSVYVFCLEADQRLTEADFIDYLDDSYEEDRDESVHIFETTIEHFANASPALNI